MTEDNWPDATRIVHLPGGLYAVSHTGEKSVTVHGIAPARDENAFFKFEIESYGALYSSLAGRGLQPLGVEFYQRSSQVDGIEPPELRHFYRIQGIGPWPSEEGARTWSQIANTASSERADIPLADLCRRISFELRACVLKWFDISQAYSRTLNGVLREQKLGLGAYFENGNSFAVYVAIHSFFSELSILRDYLAEFAAQFVLRSKLDVVEQNYISRMATLVKALRKLADVEHPLASLILEIAGEGSGGWLAEMSAHRDLLIHHAPVAMPEGAALTMYRNLELPNGGAAPGIAFFLPAKPEDIKRARARGSRIKTQEDWVVATLDSMGKGPEALEYAHLLLGRMAELALTLASYSPVPPTVLTLTEKDLAGPITVTYE